MRRPYLAMAAALTIAVLAPVGRASAQGIGVTADPFSFYYGYYLPHQAAIAAQPTPLDTINQITAQRQYAAQTDRSSLYDPISPYGDEDDSTTPFGRRGTERRAKVQGFTYGANSGNARGVGPAAYYGRTARYFPGLREGRGANQNLAKTRGARGGGGFGGGMPGLSMPGVGPR
jgi:hypothetical protein